ncbi:hypothetical protein V8C37DRAFT_213091 [Trichoderma ceciliae]
MPSLKRLLSALALACLANGETIKITATSSNTFNPSSVQASDGDTVEFHFQPVNHSVVAGDFRFPCSPLQLGTGFYSGFFPTSSGESNKVFRVVINGTDPVPFYSSQGNECASGMVGIINPSGNVTLADYRQRASTLARSVTPGTVPFGGEIADNDSSSNSTSGGNGNGSGSGNSTGNSTGDSSGDNKNGNNSGSISLSVSIGALGLAFLMAI